jgi:Rieske Fe-S protein
VFDAVGNNVSGPPPKPLERYASKIDGGKVFIRLEV